MLLYFECDGSYDIISSNSMVLATDFDVSKAEMKDKISLKPDLIGILMAKSPYLKDIDFFQRRLEAKLQKGILGVEDSFGFLDTSASASGGINDVVSDSDTGDSDAADDGHIPDSISPVERNISALPV